jgi:hypothetical protein
VGVRQDLADALENTGIEERIGAERIFREQAIRFTSTQKGVQYAFGFMGEPCETCPLKDSELHTKAARYSV